MRPTDPETDHIDLPAVVAPRDLWYVTSRRRSSRIVCWIPVGRPVVDLIEIRTANRNVERCRCQSADCQALRGSLLGIEVVAASRATVSRRKNYRNSLHGCLFPQAVVKSVPRTAQVLLAVSAALAHDRGQ